MPNFDGTGPIGTGPKIGRRSGPCGLGLGWHRRFGLGRGMGKYFGSWTDPQTKEDKLKALSDYKKALEEELADVKQEEEDLKEE